MLHSYGARKAIANLPLHYGKAPHWLFERMVKLSKSLIEILIMEYGREELLRRLSDPFWFQSFGCILGFDWHSSGLTTTLCGAIKEALRGLGDDIGVYAVGGKGRSALNTPKELDALCKKVGADAEALKDVSRLVAKVDNVLLQDGYQLYHHTLIFTKEGLWCVVQQGMNVNAGYARRYHWLSFNVKSFVEEPHSGICGDAVHEMIDLNMVAKESKNARDAIKELLSDRRILIKELEKIETLNMPKRHYISPKDFNVKKLKDDIKKLEEREIKVFEDVLRIVGVGSKMIRALALVSELIFGTKASFKDPAKYAFAHGGKDGHPYPVRRDIYDATIDSLKRILEKAKMGDREKIEAIKKLSRILS